MPELLEVRDLTAHYGATSALHGIAFSLAVGGIVAILGANGAGKTTLLRAICQTVRTGGSILFDGRQLARRATEDIVRLGIAHVPEGCGTFGDLSVEENLRLGAHVRRDRRAVAADISRIYELFPLLRARCRQRAGLLSRGEQQILAIGRALLLRPRLLLLDEPSAGLAPRIIAEIMQTLRGVNEREGVGILLAEANAHVAFGLADRALVLETGRLVLAGTSAELRREASVRRAYLGGRE
jgi:branched-chain amino acid transport system ATP-binding protein